MTDSSLRFASCAYVKNHFYIINYYIICHNPDAYKAAKGLRMYSLQRKCNRSLEKIILEAVMITCWLKVLEVSIVTVCLIMLLQIKIDLPDYVRFSPKSPEVILLLKRFIRKEQMPTCAVQFHSHADLQDTVSSNGWSAAAYPYFEEDEYWFFLHRKQQATDKKNVDRRLGDLGTWKARGRSTNIYIGAQLVGIKQKYELMKGKVKTGWFQFEYTRFSNKFEKICVAHLIFVKKPEVDYPSDISEEEEEEEEEEQEEEEEEEESADEEEQGLQVQAPEVELVNEQQGLHEQVLNLEEEEAAASDEVEQTLANEQQRLQQVQSHEVELGNEHQGLQEQVVNFAHEEALTFVNDFLDDDDDEDWARFLNTDDDGLAIDDLFEDGDSEKTLEHVNEQQSLQDQVLNLEEEAAAAADDEEEQTRVNEVEQQGGVAGTSS
ncbi:unnamed protein product [Brassica rapa]|uniref:NAC domain-containing protein n=1 Tax=Brassica campestris TaxID=3711 RepID=A0A8D9HKY2_BRACM|nr:unnamed protein product [Brassica rapa]